MICFDITKNHESFAFKIINEDLYLILTNFFRDYFNKNMQEQISLSAPFSHAWEKFKQNPGFLIGIQLIIILLSVIENQLSEISYEAGSMEWSILNLFFLGVSTYFSMGILRIYLKCTDGKPLDFNDIVSPFQLFLKYFIAQLIYLAAVIIGMIVFILPGLFFGIRLMFFGYLVVDEELSATEAIKQSFSMTKGYFWPLLGFSAMIILINIAGFLFLVVGLLVTLPVSSIAVAYLYRKLRGEFSTPSFLNVQAGDPEI